MKRKTLDFIIRQNGGATGLAAIGRKKLIIIVSVVLGVLLLGGAYLWYVHNYVNVRKVELQAQKKTDYEWVSDASEQGLVKDYLWSRTKELMLKNSEDNILIVSRITLPGKLLEQTLEESGEYDLGDQALLLMSYVRENDRIKASELVQEVDKRFDLPTEDTGCRIGYLEAFLAYYSSYGSKSDEEKLTKMLEGLFDEEGMLKPSKIDITGYEGQAYVSSNDTEAALANGKAMGELESGSDADVSHKKVSGVYLSSVDLKLIRDLENNGFLPEGSYEKNLELVKNGLISSEIPLFALCSTDEGYVYTSGVSGAVNVARSVVIMRNLALVGELPSSSFSWLKSTLYGNEIFSDTLNWTSGKFEGEESFDSYFMIAEIAVALDDEDLFSFCSKRIATHVATLDSSPALSMIFRSENGRNLVYANDNLRMNLLLAS